MDLSYQPKFDFSSSAKNGARIYVEGFGSRNLEAGIPHIHIIVEF